MAALPLRPAAGRRAAWGSLSLGLTLLLAAVTAPAEAQIAADAPRLISPHGSGGVGVHLLSVPTEPGTDRAVLLTWALRALPDGVRLRAATGNGIGNRSALALGLDVQAPILRAAALPLDVTWQGGIGVSDGTYTLVSLPMGITTGLAWQSGTVLLAPFATGGLVADLRRGRDAPDEEFRMRGNAELGLDLSFDRERSVVLRAAHVLAGRRSSSLGLAFNLGRFTR